MAAASSCRSITCPRARRSIGGCAAASSPANPIGVVFDPQELVGRYAARESVDQLTARPPLPAGISPFEMLRF